MLLKEIEVFKKEKSSERNILDVEKKVLKIFSKSLGYRIIKVECGGAKTNPKMFKWIQKCFTCISSEGYGISEVGGIAGNFIF